MDNNILLKKLKEGDSKAISLLYEYFPVVKNYIVKNSGSDSDAKDVFQEALIILYKKLQSNNFEFKSKVETFVFGISKNLWFEELRKRNKSSKFLSDDYLKYDNLIKNHFAEEKKYEQMDLILINLGEKCAEILKLFYFKCKSMEDIADLLNYKNINTVKTQKYKCLERAKKMAFEKNIFINLKTSVQ